MKLKINKKKKKKNFFSNLPKKDTNRNKILKKGFKTITNFAKKIFTKDKSKDKKNIESIYKETNLLCENCNINNSIKNICLCKDCISKLLFNECLVNYNDCIENNIEFDINNFYFTYKDKNYIRKDFDLI